VLAPCSGFVFSPDVQPVRLTMADSVLLVTSHRWSGMGVLIGSGTVLVMGLIFTLFGLEDLRRYARLRRQSRSPIAEATGSEPVEIRGRVVAGEQGVVLAPFSGENAVWVKITIDVEHVEVRMHAGRSSRRTWETVVEEADARPFFVDDGSGQLARVVPDGVVAVIDPQSEGDFGKSSPALDAFLASRGITPSKVFDFDRRMRYAERVLLPGDDVYAMGPSRRVPGMPVPDGYRSGVSTQLELAVEDLVPSELLMSNRTKEQLLSKLKNTFRVGAVMCAVGLGGVAVGLLIALTS
jgi:hypothetical protein